MQRTTYTVAEKEHALRRCAEIGIQKTSEELGIAVGSLYAWRRKSGQDEASPVADAGAAIPAENAVATNTPRASRKIANTNKPASEELIRLRTENAAHKAQIISLKKALRAFTE